MKFGKIFGLVFTLLSIYSYADVYSYGNNTFPNIDPNLIFQMMPKYTIKAGSRTPEQNREHQKYCDQIGAKDITDTVDIQVGFDNFDPMDTVVFCVGSGTPPPGNLAGAGSEN